MHGELDINLVNALSVHVSCEGVVVMELITKEDACCDGAQVGGINVNASTGWIEI